MVKKKLVKLVDDWLPSEFIKGFLPHQAPSPCRCVHSHAWQLKKARPPRMVKNIYSITFFLLLAWPAPTASTMVTELMIRIKVIRLTKASGMGISPCTPGKVRNTSLGS